MSAEPNSLPGTPNSFSRPRPRPPKSPAETAQIRVRNRRREYLERNQAYYQSAEHELADPLLYDSLVRRFQIPAEREAEGRSKGYARVLEGSLMRGEERLARMAESWHQDPTNGGSASADHNGATHPAAGAGSSLGVADEEVLASDPPADKADGRARWDAFLRERFVRGEDEDFDYARVDGNEEYDVLERKDKEDAWFDDEDPRWAGSSEEDGGREGDEVADGPVQVERRLEGETGVQDF